MSRRTVLRVATEVLQLCIEKVRAMLDSGYDSQLASHLSYLTNGYAAATKVLDRDTESLTPEIILERLGQFTAAERAHVLREASKFDEEARNVIG